jgi:glutamine synthetase
VLDEGGYFDLTTLDAGSDLRRETVLALEQLGDPHRVHPPRGRALPARDRHALRRRAEDGRRLHDLPDHGQGVRDEVRLHATFMPKPLFGENGSGMHTHQSLFKGGQATRSTTPTTSTSSPTSARRSSPASSHAREICSIFAQWVNSYKRLVPGYEAPVYVAWSRRNRSALVRVPMYHPGKEKATRMELRCPDPACNPYLTFAVLLQAGLEGIEHGYELPDPMEKNLYHLSPEERRRLGIEQLPRRSARRSS